MHLYLPFLPFKYRSLLGPDPCYMPPQLLLFSIGQLIGLSDYNKYIIAITSGVTSLGEKPVPPVVNTKWISSISAHFKSTDYSVVKKELMKAKIFCFIPSTSILFIYLFINSFIHSFFHLSTYLPTYSPIHPPTHPSIHSPIRPSIYQFIHLKKFLHEPLFHSRRQEHILQLLH